VNLAQIKRSKFMKRKITLTVALVVSVVLVSLMSSDAPVRAAPPQRFKVDTGVIIPGPNQKLRVTVVRSVDVVILITTFRNSDKLIMEKMSAMGAYANPPLFQIRHSAR
jgi:hypothetical protein